MSSQEEKYRELHMKIEQQLHNLVPQNQVLPISQMIWRLMEEDFSHLSRPSDEAQVKFKEYSKDFIPHTDTYFIKLIGYSTFFHYFSLYLNDELKKFCEKEDLDPNEMFIGFLSLILAWFKIVNKGYYLEFMRHVGFTDWSVNQEEAFANVIRTNILKVMQYADENLSAFDAGAIEKDVELKLNNIWARIMHNKIEGTFVPLARDIFIQFPKNLIDPKRFESRKSDESYIGSLNNGIPPIFNWWN